MTDTTWRSRAACRTIVPPAGPERLPGLAPEWDEDSVAHWRTSLFYPGDLSRTGPLTAELRATVVAEMHAGAHEQDVADRHGLSLRQVRYWLTLTANDLANRKARRTLERPGVSQAKVVCAACPVRLDCLEHALASGEQHGVWGGMDPEERRMELRRRRTAA